MTYFVIMTDTFMSGWGVTKGKINKLVISCDTLEQASLIERNARNRKEMKNVTVKEKVPYYSDKTHLLTYKTFSDMGGSWLNQ